MTAVERRMRSAIQLRELTIAMQRESLKRRYPTASEREIQARLHRWVMEVRPSARAAARQ